MKTGLQLLALLTVLLWGCAEVSPTRPSSPVAAPTPTTTPSDSMAQHLPIEAHLFVRDRAAPIELEVARTPEQQARGLMYRTRTSLPDDRGMYFPFEPARPVSFWMKNVQFSLDMIFVHQGKIVAIATDVPPCVLTPCPSYGPENQAVDGVIELRGGRATELNLQPGDPIRIEYLSQ